MAYRSFKYWLVLYLFLLLVAFLALGFFIHLDLLLPAGITGLVFLWLLVRCWSFVTRRFTVVTDFLESVKYRDFSRLFNDSTGPRDLRRLHKQFNVVIETIREVNQENTLQNLYLQKILELADTGIIAYNTGTGNILWINDNGRELLNVPAFRHIDFLKKRKPDFYEKIIGMRFKERTLTETSIENERLKLLVSDALFHTEKEEIRILAFQNIDETLDHTETEAWKKLLSVMTHEIMNSIAPIHSLSETLQGQLLQQRQHPEQDLLEMNDLLWGMESISKRSEGLMQFAKTYRSLHKVTELRLQNIPLAQLLDDIYHLLAPSVEQKEITMSIQVQPEELSLDIDRHLIEQVLINLIKNAMEALQDISAPAIMIRAYNNARHHTIIEITDNGPGIPQEIQDKIFVPFYTSKKAGSGIGLSLCKQIMLLHRGKIQVETTGPEGTTMSLIF